MWRVSSLSVRLGTLFVLTLVFPLWALCPVPRDVAWERPAAGLDSSTAIRAEARLPPDQPVAAGSMAPDTQRRLASLQRYLQEAGADYMLLQRVSTDPLRYRFDCQMKLAPDAIYSRAFTTTDSSPVRALERTVAAVRAWQQGG